MKSNQIVVSFSQFAFGLGKQDDLLRESSLVWHLEYVTANSATRKARQDEWIINYFMGNLKVTQKVAERILSMSRTQRTKDQQASYYRAYSDFSYHIIRPEKKKKVSATSGTAVSSQVDIVEKALELVESMTKKQQDKFFSRVTRKK